MCGLLRMHTFFFAVSVYYPKDGSAVWCGQAAQSYEALYGPGWRLHVHVVEFDVVHLTYYPKDESAVLVWSSCSELQS